MMCSIVDKYLIADVLTIVSDYLLPSLKEVEVYRKLVIIQMNACFNSGDPIAKLAIYVDNWKRDKENGMYRGKNFPYSVEAITHGARGKYTKLSPELINKLIKDGFLNFKI